MNAFVVVISISFAAQGGLAETDFACALQTTISLETVQRETSVMSVLMPGAEAATGAAPAADTPAGPATGIVLQWNKSHLCFRLFLGAGMPCSLSVSCALEGYILLISGGFLIVAVKLLLQVGPVQLATLQVLCCFVAVMGMSAVAALIPIAFDIARFLSLGAFESGLIIGAGAVGALAGSLLCRFSLSAMTYKWRRGLIPFSLWCGGAVNVLLYVVMVHWSTGNIVKYRTILLLRVVAALFQSVGGILLQAITLNVTPSSQMTLLQLALQACRNLGNLFGPVIVLVAFRLRPGRSCNDSTQQEDTIEVYSLPFLLIGLTWTCLSVLAAVLTQMIEHTDESFEAGEEEVAENSRVDLEPIGPLRKTLFWYGHLFAAERLCSCLGAEVATSQILEVQYKWHASQVGVGLMWVGAVTVSVCLSLAVLTKLECADERTSMKVLLGFAFTGPLVLFDSHWTSAAAIIAGDCVFYSCQTANNGLILSKVFQELTVKHGNPSREQFTVNLCVMAGVIGLGAPPFIRLVIDKYGRNAYAVAQTLLLLVGTLTAAKIGLLAEKMQALHLEMETRRGKKS